MSARFLFIALYGIFLCAAAASAVAADNNAATVPSTAAPDTTAPTKDEAAAAAQESQEALRHSDGVAAIVNDSVISNYDVRQRVGLYTATSGVHPSAEEQAGIRTQVLKQLETERLELLEAEKNKISVGTPEVDKAIDSIMQENHLSADQMKAILAHSDVRMATLRGQIAAQIAWSKLVQEALGDRVHVSKLDVDDEMARLQQGANQPHYLVSEIFQAVDTPEQDGKVKKDMDNLEVQLQSGASFAVVARQLSQNPTAAQGGDLGIVQDGQLAPELDAVLKTMRIGQVSQPIRSTGGYYILLLRAREEGVNAKIPDPVPQETGPPGTLPLARVLLPIGPKPTKTVIQSAVQAAAEIRAHVAGCEHLKEMVDHIPGAIYMSLGNMRLSDLSQDMRDAVTHADAGSATPPMGSQAGVELLVRCDKPVPKISRFVLPSRDQVEQRIYAEQMDTLQRQYLRDLRRDADIETR